MEPINTGNALIIENVTRPLINLAIVRHESLFNAYTEEPQFIRVQERENGPSRSFEQVFRIRKWCQGSSAYSWQIYSDCRVFSGRNVILRKTVWNVKEDVKTLQECDITLREQFRAQWPKIEAKAVFLNETQLPRLIGALTQLDDFLNYGIQLDARDDSYQTLYADVEIMRRFEWGQVVATWGHERQNRVLEDNLVMLEQLFEQLLDEGADNIHKMAFDYLIPMEEIRKYTCGEGRKV